MQWIGIESHGFREKWMLASARENAALALARARGVDCMFEARNFFVIYPSRSSAYLIDCYFVSRSRF